MKNKKIGKNYFIAVIALLILGAFLAAVKFNFPQYFLASVIGNKSKQNLEIRNKSVEVLPPEQCDFTLNSNTYSPDSVMVISNFEKNEDNNWQGNGVYDEKVYFEGDRSLGVISSDRRNVAVILEKKLDLTNMQYIEFMMNISDRTAYESIILDFGDSDLKSYYRYSLTNLTDAWNLIQIPKDKFILHQAKDSIFDWLNVEKTRFYVLSRPDSILLTRIDMLKSINNSNDFLKHWNITRGVEEMFLSLYNQDGKIKLMARNKGVSVAALREIENQNNFIFSATLSPQTSARSGLFIRGDYNNGYGYYFEIYGDKKNIWRIFKRNKNGWTPKQEIIQGTLENVTFSRNNKYWLRVDARGNVMEFYLSFDGKKYEKLGELIDDEFSSGGVGIFVFDNGWSLFDDFKFKSL